MRYVRLDHCLKWAYDLSGAISGPDWIHFERYDITAKAPEPVPLAQLKLMVQTLLADRFKMTVHRETKDFMVYALVVGKNGPKNLAPAEATEEPRMEQRDGQLVFKHAPMSYFANMLVNRPPYGLNETVVDRTGLKGVFDMTFSVKAFNVDDPAFAGNYNEVNHAFFVFFSGVLEKQYGLKVERRKAPLDTLVIDQANRVPTEN